MYNEREARRLINEAQSQDDFTKAQIHAMLAIADAIESLARVLEEK